MALAALELVGLGWYFRATGRGVPPRWLAANLAAGGALLVALRLAIGGAWWGWIGLALAGAGLAHAVDMRQRWRANPAERRIQP